MGTNTFPVAESITTNIKVFNFPERVLRQQTKQPICEIRST